MSEALGAARQKPDVRLGASLEPPDKFDHASIWRAVDEVHAIAAGTSRDIGELKVIIGAPARGDAAPATGIFNELGKLDGRLKPFEKLRERLIGACFVLGGAGAVFWFLEGAKIARFFHG